MSTRPAPRADERDAEAVYRRVATLVRDWRPDPAAGFTVARDLAGHLDGRLNADRAGEERVAVEVGGDRPYDVLVAGTVAVVVYRDFGPGTVSEFSAVVGEIARTCEYLVVYAHDLPERDLDRWRMGKARYTADRSALSGVSYVRGGPGDGGTAAGDGWPSRLWHYAEPLVALLAILIGVEAGVILNLEFGGLAPLMGPVASLATILALTAVLVLLYERTEV